LTAWAEGKRTTRGLSLEFWRFVKNERFREEFAQVYTSVSA